MAIDKILDLIPSAWNWIIGVPKSTMVFFFISVTIALSSASYIYINEKGVDEKIIIEIHKLGDFLREHEQSMNTYWSNQIRFNDSIIAELTVSSDNVVSLIKIQAMQSQNIIVREIYEISKNNMNAAEMRNLILEVLERSLNITRDEPESGGGSRPYDGQIQVRRARDIQNENQ